MITAIERGRVVPKDLAVKRIVPGNDLLAVRMNKKLLLTPKGELAKALTTLTMAMQAQGDPTKTFAMTDEYRKNCIYRIERLCKKLGLPEEEGPRREAIRDLGNKLSSLGIISNL